jgi:hypothetical protein
MNRIWFLKMCIFESGSSRDRAGVTREVWMEWQNLWVIFFRQKRVKTVATAIEAVARSPGSDGQLDAHKFTFANQQLCGQNREPKTFQIEDEPFCRGWLFFESSGKKFSGSHYSSTAAEQSF